MCPQTPREMLLFFVTRNRLLLWMREKVKVRKRVGSGMGRKEMENRKQGVLGCGPIGKGVCDWGYTKRGRGDGRGRERGGIEGRIFFLTNTL